MTETEINTPSWVSYAEAERRFGISRTSMWRLVKDGHIRAAKIGRSVRLDARSIERFLDERAQEFEADLEVGMD